MNAVQLSRGLGWFSIGLGLTELLAPRQLGRTIGLSDGHESLLRVLGARELASGLGLLALPKPTAFAWSRVAGDIMNLSLLGAALHQTKSQPMSVSRSQDDDRRRLTGAIVAVAGVTLVDLLVSTRLSQSPKTDPSWHYTPTGGRDGLRRPLEVDQPRHLPVDEQIPDRSSRRNGLQSSTGELEESAETSFRSKNETSPQGL